MRFKVGALWLLLHTPEMVVRSDLESFLNRPENSGDSPEKKKRIRKTEEERMLTSWRGGLHEDTGISWFGDQSTTWFWDGRVAPELVSDGFAQPRKWFHGLV
eukprot:c7039_g1_i1.p2 GENE.c7039_g1_i1~~c7039_g1_i1.p2  ORF type:complete len:102 (-),score=10.31 c7039_g1_i1:27-332(-)